MAFLQSRLRGAFGALRGDELVDPLTPNYVSPQLDLTPSSPAPFFSAPKKKRRIKLGPVKKCKVVPVTGRDGKRRKRRMCWDAHGHLVRNEAAGSRKGGGGASKKRGLKRVCKLKCKEGSSPFCKGGFRKAGKGHGATKVCRKWVCRKKRR